MIEEIVLIPAIIGGFGFGIALASYFNGKSLNRLQKEVNEIRKEILNEI